MKVLRAIAYIFSKPKLRPKVLLYFIGLFLLLAIPTALLSNPIIPYVRMIPAAPLDYFFLFTTAFLSSVYLVLPENTACKNEKSAFGGGVLGVLSFSCPTCIMLLVFLLGFDFMYNVVNPLRPLLGIASLVVLTYAIEKKFSGKKAEKTGSEGGCG